MKRVVRVSVILAAIAAALAIGLWFAFPKILADEVKNEARRQGVELTIDSVKLSPTAAEFRGVRGTTATGLPFEAQLRTDFDLAFLLKRYVTIRDGTIKVGVGPTMVLAPVTGLIARHEGRSLGSATKLEASVIVTSGGKRIGGPWKLAMLRSGPSSEETLDLRPSAPQTALAQRWTNRDTSRTRVVIKGARIEDLALPPFPLAPPTSLVEVELDAATQGKPPDDQQKGTLKVAFSRFTIPGAPAAAPMSIAFAFEGAGVKGRLFDGKFLFGPFTGTAAGAIDFSGLPELSLELTGTKTPCAALATSVANDVLPGAAALASALGLDRAGKDLVRGEVGFVGTAHVALADLDTSRLEVKPVGACSIDVPFFPQGLLGPK